MKFVLFFISIALIAAGGAYYIYTKENAKTKTFENWEITVGEVKKTDSVVVEEGKEGWVYKANGGKAYIVAELTVRNKSNNKRTFYLGSEIHLTFENEKSFEAEDMFLDDKHVNAAKIDVEGEISGFVAFLVPDDLANNGSKAKLSFGTSKENVVFKISVTE